MKRRKNKLVLIINKSEKNKVSKGILDKLTSVGETSHAELGKQIVMIIDDDYFSCRKSKVKN